jgi:SAM-dependent methyltransferase
MMKLPEELVASLRCPNCQRELEDEGDALRCIHQSCRATYPIVNGVPILICEARSLVSIDEVVALARGSSSSSPSFARRLGRKLLPSLSLNLKAANNFRCFADLLGESGKAKSRVLILGSGDIGVGLEDLFELPHLEFVESDVVLGGRVKVVCDAQDIPFADGTFDGVIIQGVLEFLPEVEDCLSHVCRVLKPGGLVYAETPFMQQLGGRYDLTRYTDRGHRRLFRRFEEVLSGPVGGPGMALGWSYKFFLLSFASSHRVRLALTVIAHLTGFWLKYFDYFLIRRPGAMDAAAGFGFLGRKSDRVLTDREVIAGYHGRMAGTW